MLAILLLLAWQSSPQTPSPVEQRISAAHQQVAANPKAFDAYNILAASLCRKGRDTGSAAVYDEANAAVDKSLALSPDNYDALKLRVSVLIGKHEFAPALELAKKLNHKVPDDIAVWASLVDIYVGLHNNDEAERSAQWILDLRRANALGFEKAAGLREIFGDSEGAIQFYEEALTRTAQGDFDQRAWLLTQKARLQLASGNPKAAADTLNEALRLFPDSQLAANVQADLKRTASNRGESK